MPWPTYLAALEAHRRGVDLPAGRVPDTFLVADVGGEIVGRASIRHELNEFLAGEGGHIGFGVLAERRRRGYGTEILRQSLVIARAVAIDRVLVTCDDENLGVGREYRPVRRCVRFARRTDRGWDTYAPVLDRLTCEADVGMEHPDTRRVWDANAPAWIEMSRAGFDVYRDLINSPAFFELLPDVDGLLGLDLGCGEGHNTRLLARRGADVVALDVSRPFISAAAAREGSDPEGISYLLGDACRLPFAAETFEFVTAVMSLMDVGAPETALGEVSRVLRPAGLFQFSIGHPFSGTPIRRWVASETGERHALTIGDYFYEGPLEETWTFGAAPEQLRRQRRPFHIVYARRTLATWLNTVIQAGFVIEAVAEPHPDPELATSHPEVSDARIAPYFLLVRARKLTT